MAGVIEAAGRVVSSLTRLQSVSAVVESKQQIIFFLLAFLAFYSWFFGMNNPAVY
jgi:hypothetical protein